MTRSVFDPDFDELPRALPIFPLAGALLLPGGRLPLNVFEPRYLSMTSDAIVGDRMIGMVQPLDGDRDADHPQVYRIGCAGRIVSFSETDDGRYLITLSGLIRFDIAEELSMKNGYRRVAPAYDRFQSDMDETNDEIDRDALLCALTEFFTSNGIEGDWDAIKQTPDERLITSLAMICPFEPSEKQALLEAISLAERANTMITILRMSAHQGAGEGEPN